MAYWFHSIFFILCTFDMIQFYIRWNKIHKKTFDNSKSEKLLNILSILSTLWKYCSNLNAKTLGTETSAYGKAIKIK